jgi:hypothetical protein
MELLTKILPMLWQIIEKNKNCAVNVSTIDNKLTINILFGRKKKSFSHSNEAIILSQLKEFLAA